MIYVFNIHPLFLFCSMQIILLCCVSRLLNGAKNHKITTYWKCSERFQHLKPAKKEEDTIEF